MSLFEGRRAYPGQNISLTIPFAAVRGKAIQRDATYPGKGALASGTALGFLARDVVAGGPSVLDRAGVFPGRLELQDAVDGECALEVFDEVEVEGGDYVLLSGTGAITGGTTRGTKLAFSGGKFYQAQSGDVPQFLLADNSGLANTQLTPEVEGAIRIRAERIV